MALLQVTIRKCKVKTLDEFQINIFGLTIDRLVKRLPEEIACFTGSLRQ